MTKRNLVVVISYLFISAICINLFYPVSPAVYEHLNVDRSWYGYLVSINALSASLFSFLWFYLIKKVKIKWLFPISLIGFTIAQSFLLVPISPLFVFVSRALAGIFSSACLLIGNVALSIYTTSKADKIMRFSSGFVALGNSLGFLIGGVLGTINFQITLIVEVALAMIFAIIIVPLYNEKKQVVSSNNDKLIQGISKKILLLNVIVLLGFAVINASIPFLVTDRKLNSQITGIIMFIIGVLGLLLNLLISSKILKFLRETTLIFLSLSTAAVLSVIGFFIFDFFWFLIVLIIIFISLINLIRPAIYSLFLKEYQDNNSAMSFFNFSMYIGSFLGGGVTSLAYKQNPSILMLAASIALLLGVIFIILRFNKKSIN